MIMKKALRLALDESISEEMLEAALAKESPVRWGPATPEQLAAYARKPLLLRGEAVALLQGLTPPTPHFGNEKIYYLDDYADVVQRLLHDCEGGAIPIPCRPLELLKWATTLGIQLPEPFCVAVNSEDPSGPAGDPARATQAGTNEWAVRLDAPRVIAERHASAPPAKYAEGTTASEANDGLQPLVCAVDDYARWQEMAEGEARKYRADNHKWPSKVAVAKVLAKQISVEASTIERQTRNTWSPSRRGTRQSSQR